MQHLPVVRASALSVAALLVSAPGPAAEKKAPPPAPPLITSDALKGLEFRNIGPAIMRGRIDDFAAGESRASTFYVGAPSGGLWRTRSMGPTSEPGFADQESSTISDIATPP